MFNRSCPTHNFLILAGEIIVLVILGRFKCLLIIVFLLCLSFKKMHIITTAWLQKGIFFLFILEWKSIDLKESICYFKSLGNQTGNSVAEDADVKISLKILANSPYFLYTQYVFWMILQTLWIWVKLVLVQRIMCHPQLSL